MPKVTGLTPKQAAFALNLFKGMSQREAYVKAGYSDRMNPNTMDANASRLADNTMILARIAELTKQAENASIMTVVERKQILTEIGRGRITNYLDGNKINATLNGLNTAAIAEVNTAHIQVGKGEDTPIVEITKLKLHDPVKAIAELNRMEKLYAEEKGGDTYNTQINIIVESDKGESFLKRVTSGERTSKEVEGES